MSDHPKAMDHMLAGWNETNPDRIRGHLDQALSEDIRFVDPGNDIVGIDAFEVMVKAFREKYPSAECSRSSAVDAHHHLYRYHWAIHNDGQLVLPGFDVVETDASDRVAVVLGFFGPLAPSVS